MLKTGFCALLQILSSNFCKAVFVTSPRRSTPPFNESGGFLPSSTSRNVSLLRNILWRVINKIIIVKYSYLDIFKKQPILIENYD